MTEFGWNLSVINVMPTPTAAPDFGGDGHPTYNIKVWKHKGKRFESENVTDTGASSPGRLITEALEATRFARALANGLDPSIDRFIVWRPLQRRETTDKARRITVGPIRLGLDGADAAFWGKKIGTGSPFQRGRRTVVVERGEPSQHSPDTHERRRTAGQASSAGSSTDRRCRCSCRSPDRPTPGETSRSIGRQASRRAR